MAIDVGTGTSIAFGTSAFAATVTSMSFEGVTREAIDTTHLGTTKNTAMGSRTFIPGDLSDAGSLTLEIIFDPALTPPIEGAVETITVTFGDSGAATWAFSGFVTSYSASVPLEALMTGSMTVKISGKITVTP